MRPILTVLLGIGLVAFSVMGAPAYGPEQILEPQIFAQVTGGLDLDAQKTEDLKDLCLKYARDVIEIDAELRTAELELKALMTCDDPDREDLEKAIDALYQAKAERRKADIFFRLDLRELLGPRQMGYFEEFVHQWTRPARHHDGHEEHPRSKEREEENQ